jgi:hypothetical protein
MAARAVLLSWLQAMIVNGIDSRSVSLQAAALRKSASGGNRLSQFAPIENIDLKFAILVWHRWILPKRKCYNLKERFCCRFAASAAISNNCLN